MTSLSRTGWLSVIALSSSIAALAAVPFPIASIGPVNPSPVAPIAPIAPPTASVPTAAASAAPETSTPTHYLIHPYNVPDTCVGYEGQLINDNLSNPPSSRGVMNAITLPCPHNVANSYFLYWGVEILNYNDGKPWDGKSDTDVVIKMPSISEECLENASEAGYGGGDFQFDGCASQTPTSRYVFHISVNPNGAIELTSTLDGKCFERNGPQAILALPCGGVGNWMVEKSPS